MDRETHNKTGPEHLHDSPWEHSSLAESESSPKNLSFLDIFSDIKDRLLGSGSSGLKAKPSSELAPARPIETQRGDSLPTLILLKTQTDAKAREEQVEKVAAELAKFISGADKTLDLSIYSFNIKDPEAQKMIVDALNERAEAGVDIRLAYFQAEPRRRLDGESSSSGSFSLSSQDRETNEFLLKLSPRISTQNLQQGAVKLPDSLSDGIETGAISGNGSLMHNKYVVRDSGASNAAVWTGSTNWTDDAFGTQDNNIIQLKSKDVAEVFQTNFNEMWEQKSLTGTGKDQHRTVKMGDSTVTIAFSPGDGPYIEQEIARRIAAADRNVHVASMDVSNYYILKALVKELGEGTKIDGIYDKSQMNVVIKQWERNDSPSAREKLAMWNQVKEHLLGKDTPRGMREMMHNKTVQIDDKVVVTGSFNFTSNATRNAENVVIIENPTIAKQYGAYINDLVISYGGMPRT